MLDSWSSVPQSQRDVLRDYVFERDGYRCQIQGPRCVGPDPLPRSKLELDHIIARASGGAILNPDNCRASCRPCNRGRSRQERTENGWRRSKTRIVLVTGPPASGKSTYVREHAAPEDLVVDYDALAQAIGSPVTHGHASGHREAVKAARNALIRRIRAGEVEAPRAWIVSANPEAVRIFPHHEVVRMDPGEDVVRERVAQQRPAEFEALLDDWYQPAGSAPPSREW